MQLIPYLTFNGNCEEALNYYAGILDGKVNIVTRYNDPNMGAPDDYKDKVLHATFEFGQNIIMASDVMFGKDGSRGTMDAAMSISISDEKKGEEIFNQLSDGGKVGVPFAKQFWGDWHGNLVDRYGIRWMVNK